MRSLSPAKFFVIPSYELNIPLSSFNSSKKELLHFRKPWLFPALSFINCSKCKNLVKNKINKLYNTFNFDKFQIILQRKNATISEKLLRNNLALEINIEIFLVSKQHITILCNFPNL